MPYSNVVTLMQFFFLFVFVFKSDRRPWRCQRVRRVVWQAVLEHALLAVAFGALGLAAGVFLPHVLWLSGALHALEIALGVAGTIRHIAELRRIAR